MYETGEATNYQVWEVGAFCTTGAPTALYQATNSLKHILHVSLYAVAECDWICLWRDLFSLQPLIA